MEFLKELNESQLKAVTCKDGPLLIVAGAGSGKTKVLTYRIAYLVSKGIHPGRIMAVTFTNKAAEEMKNRLSKVIGKKAKDLWIGTFHSICARILRKEIRQLGLKSSFVIYDDYDKRKLIETCLKDLQIDPKKNPPRGIAYIISAAKNELIDSETFLEKATDYKEKVAADVYRLYQERLYLNNALDFDDLIMLTVNVLELSQETLRRYQDHLQHVFIDEYQDTNHAQYRLANLLAQKHKNICVVGDSDQSIYRWRGADIRNILNFEKDYKDCRTILLEQNYRSTQNILEAANSVISNNAQRKAKNLWTARGEGEPLTVFEASDEHVEADYVARTISSYLERGMKHNDFAIFYRVNAQSRVLEEAFLREGLPYKIIGGVKFYERLEIKDVLAYLRVLVNDSDSISFTRIINRPRRGIGDTSVKKIIKYSRDNNATFYKALQDCEQINTLQKSAVEKIKNFVKLIKKLKSFEKENLVKLVDIVLRKSGYVDALKKSEDIESESRLDNLKEFINVVAEFETRHPGLTLQSFIEEISLISDADQLDDEEDYVTLMTMHNAKGLEFKI
ncbi:MAG: ATP-dependent DNA helicase PcrA, partial [Actinobacteria bacterium]